VAFQTPWDLHRVKPSFFPVPAAVVRGVRTDSATALPSVAQIWSGRVNGRNPSLADAGNRLTRAESNDPVAAFEVGSPYAPRFTQGATLVPRFLVLVDQPPAGPLGAGAGRVAVRSRRSSNEKTPWKTLPDLTGTIEQQFLRPVFVGDTVLPFRVRPAATGVIPWDGTRLETTTTADSISTRGWPTGGARPRRSGTGTAPAT